MGDARMAEDIRPEKAVSAAKRWLSEIYKDERIDQIGLEEVRFRDGNWEVTLGFLRDENDEQRGGGLAGLYPRRRIYKVLIVAGNDNHVMEMRDREVA